MFQVIQSALFHPLVGGHLNPWKGHVFTIPKKVTLNHQVPIILFFPQKLSANSRSPTSFHFFDRNCLFDVQVCYNFWMFNCQIEIKKRIFEGSLYYQPKQCMYHPKSTYLLIQVVTFLGVKTWPFQGVFCDLQRSGMKRARLELSGPFALFAASKTGTWDLVIPAPAQGSDVFDVSKCCAAPKYAGPAREKITSKKKDGKKNGGKIIQATWWLYGTGQSIIFH